MLLLTNCEVHAGKYSDRSLDVRTERSEPLWRSNTALDGPLINQSNHLFLFDYAIIYNFYSTCHSPGKKSVKLQ